MSDQLGHVDVEIFANTLEELGERLPIPLNAFRKGFVGHFLNLIEHTHQLHAVFGFQRRQGQRAIAGHNSGYTMLDGGLSCPIPQQLRVKMGMRIDEPGRNNKAFGIDYLSSFLLPTTDLYNNAVFNAYVGNKAR